MKATVLIPSSGNFMFQKECVSQLNCRVFESCSLIGYFWHSWSQKLKDTYSGIISVLSALSKSTSRWSYLHSHTPLTRTPTPSHTHSHPCTLTPPYSHSMARLLHELEELRERCTRLESILSTTGKEVEHLKLANQQAQEDLLSLRKSSVSDTV